MNEQLQEIDKIATTIHDAIIYATDPDIVGKMALHYEVPFILNKLIEIKELCNEQ